VITKNKKGYSQHPETLRWNGKLKALFLRHEKLVEEMQRRGYNHRSILSKKEATGASIQKVFVHTVKQQKEILKSKKCECRV
jgi:hypothetical protein